MTGGVPQGSILGPLHFVVYMNDLPSCNLHGNITVYADDTVLYYSSKNADKLENKLNEDLQTVSAWFRKNLLTLNTSKCKFMVFGSPQKLTKIRDLDIYANAQSLEGVESFKYLGVTVQQNMSWYNPVDAIGTKINQRLGILRRIKHLLPTHARINFYNSLISPLFDYVEFVWGDKNNTSLMHQLQVLQNRAAKVILDAPMSSSATEALNELGWHSFTKRRTFHRVMMAFKYLHGQIDFNFNIKSSKEVHDYNTRRKMDVRLPLAKQNWGQQKFVYTIFRD